MNDSLDIYNIEPESQYDLIDLNDFLIPVSFFLNIECTGRLCRNCGEYSGRPICNNRFDEFNRRIQWYEFVRRMEKCSKTLFANKLAAPLFAATIFKEERAKRRDGSYYQGWRCEPNATTSRTGVNDLDDDFTFERIHQFLLERELEGLLWTTASHQLAAPRLRLVIPYAEEVDGEMHRIAARSIVAVIEPGHKLNDPTKLGIESLAYVPGIYGSAAENKFVHTTGRVLSAEQWFEMGGLTWEDTRDQRPEPTWTASLSTRADWSYAGPLEKYMSTGHHRNNALCNFASGVACCAVHAGYDLSEGELCNILDDAQRQHHGKSPRDWNSIQRLAKDALAYAENVIDTPAYVLRDQAWDRKTAEINAMIDGSFLEPNWPEGWAEQYLETISEIQQLRSTTKMNDTPDDKKTERQREVQRLAAMSIEDCAAEIRLVAAKLVIGIGDLKKAIEEVRRAKKAEKKEQERARKQAYRNDATKGIHFVAGSSVEIANQAKSDIVEELGHFTFDEGNFWFYDGKLWPKTDPENLRLLIHQYDLRSVGEDGILGLNSNKIDSAIRELSAIVGNKEFFAGKPKGVNTLSGFVRFDGEGNATLLAHSPDHRCRYIINGRLNRQIGETWGLEPVDISGSLFEKFLNVLLQFFPAPDYRILLQEIMGAIVAELATELKQPKCLIMLGKAANNGKSSLIKLLICLVPFYAHVSVPPDKFKSQEYLIQLAGALLNTSDELSGKALESQIFKAVVDGVNEVSARDLYKSVAKFRGRALHVFACNEMPRFFGGFDRGTKRRLLLWDFPFSIPKDQMEYGIVERMIAEEMDLVLAWAIEGAQRLIRNQDYTIPKSSVENLEEHISHLDPIQGFIAARVRRDPNASFCYTQFAVFKLFRQWAHDWEYTNIPGKATFYSKFGLAFPEFLAPRGSDSRQTVKGLIFLDSDYGEHPEYPDEMDGEMQVSHLIAQENDTFDWKHVLKNGNAEPNPRRKFAGLCDD